MNFMVILPFLYFFAFLIYLYMAGYVISRNPRALLNQTCAATFISFAVWSFGMIFTQDVRTPWSLAETMYRIAAVGWISFSAFCLWFTVIFVEKRRLLKSKIFYFLIFAPVVLFLYKEWTSSVFMETYVMRYWGWSYVWGETVWTLLFVIYYSLCMLFELYILFDFKRKAKDSFKQKQAGILFNATLFTFVAASLTDVVLPWLGIYVIPNIGVLCVLVWATGMLYASHKYKLLITRAAIVADKVLSTITDSVILLLPGGDIVNVNKATCRLLGYREAELAGKRFDIVLSKEHSGSGVIGFPDVASRLDENGNLPNTEVTFAGKSGAKVPMLFSASSIYNRAGEIEGIVVVAKDISEIKKTELEMERLNKRLIADETSILRILKDLKKAHEDLQNSQEQLVESAKLASVGRLASDVAHEVNNPLMIISGRAQLSMMANPDDTALQSNLKIIQDQCERAKDIIQRLLMFASPGRGELKDVNVNDIIEFVIKIIEPHFSIKNITITRNYSKNLPSLKLDEKQMQDVFMNILKNAAEAMPGGGTITITTLVEGSDVRIDFTDTGVGIEAENLKKIFDPFFSTKEHGTGLGLSICYGILKAHGGRLKYSSAPKKGTTATVLLPVKSDD